MKKITTLAIVCMASSQLFAQSGKTTEEKAKIEAQKQKESSSMSLKQAQDTKSIPAASAALTAPVSAAKADVESAVAVQAAPVAAVDVATPAKVELAVDQTKEIQAKAALEAKLNKQRAEKEAQAAKAPKKEK